MATPASVDPAPWQRCAVQVGEWRITALSDGFMRLDGGAMWGVVPATLWRAMTPPDEDNTILMALRPFLFERGDVKAVVEVGVGDRWSDKLRRIYRILPTTSLVSTLRACEVEPSEVTHVVASHCHWDHIGAMVVERGGELVPQFPHARHFAPRSEIERAKDPDLVRKASYRAEDLLAVERAGLLEAYDGTAELFDGVRAHVLGGHSEGVAVITVNEQVDGPTAIFWSDVVPTAHHIQPPYIMAYDIDVERSFAVRSEWLGRACDEGWIGLFYHDADMAFGRLERDGRRYAAVPVESEVRAPAG